MFAKATAEPNVKRLASLAVDAHPRIFTQRDRGANEKKAPHWLRTAEPFLASKETELDSRYTISTRKSKGVAEWNDILQRSSYFRFDKAREDGVKVSRAILCNMVLALIAEPQVPVSVSQVESLKGKPVGDVISNAAFERFIITCRRRTGNTTLSAAQTLVNHKIMPHLTIFQAPGTVRGQAPHVHPCTNSFAGPDVQNSRSTYFQPAAQDSLRSLGS